MRLRLKDYSSAHGLHPAPGQRREAVTQRRVVPADVVVVKTERRLCPLAGEAVACRRRARREVRDAEGPVAHLAHRSRPAAAQGDALAAGSVVAVREARRKRNSVVRVRFAKDPAGLTLRSDPLFPPSDTPEPPPIP